MVRRIVIDVDANIANAQRTLGSLSNQLAVLNRQASLVSSTERTIAGNLLGGISLGSGNPTDPRPYLAGINTSYQQFGNTIKQVTQYTKDFGGVSLTGTLTNYAGNFDKLNATMDVYRGYLSSIPSLEAAVISQARGEIAALRGVTLSYDDLAVSVGRYQRIATAGGFRTVNTATGRFAPRETYKAQEIYDRSRQSITDLRFNNIPAQSLEDEYQRIRTAPPPLPENIGQIARESPDLLRRLTRSGIAGGTNDVSGLYNTGAAQSFKVQEDLVRQVTKVTGSFTDQFGALKRINAEYDSSGNVVTRFGGRLNNLGGALTQVGRDFLKVGEYAIATAGIYTAYQKIGETIGTVITLDKSIRQLGITANLTQEESKHLFDELATVAVETATPLTEIIGTADGVALAVRKVGDTTQETESKIVSLTRSVGILTNLSGIDAVKATDILSSAYKQLGLTVDEVPGLLNKVTAVAGGQSNAIADVITAVGQLGEAAKVGNLDLNELVGTVQVLSQVTAKTPAEVATSLKNLIGSLGSPAALKALKEYHIEVKNTDGSLRNILAIYGEISQKFSQGIIPEGDQQALIRAISGGPRRAPDAAALLGSYNQIQLAVTRSQNASNEALIANAKILDSTSAKVIQLQAAWDKFAYDKFGQTVNESVTNLLTIFQQLLDFLNKIPAGIFVFIGTLALVAIGTKAFGFALRQTLDAGERTLLNLGLYPAVLNKTAAAAGQTAAAFRTLAFAQLEEAKAAAGISSISILPGRGPSSPLNGLGGRVAKSGGLRSIALPILGGAAVGAGLDVASGASGKDTLADTLFGVGFAGLAIPEPTISKVVAGIGIIGGLLTKVLVHDEEKAKEAVHATSDELLASITAYKQASENIQAISKDNTDLITSIQELQGKNKLTITQQQELSSKNAQYGDNVVKIIEANTQLQESYRKLNENLSTLDFTGIVSPKVATNIIASIKSANNGVIDPTALKPLTAAITQAFLKATDPTNFKNIKDFKFTVPVSFRPDVANLSHFISDVTDTLTKGLHDVKVDLATVTQQQLGPGYNGVGPQKLQPPQANGSVAILSGPAPFDQIIRGAQSGIEILDLLAQAARGVSDAFKDAVDPAKKFDTTLQQLEVDKTNLAISASLNLIPSDVAERGQALLTILEKALTLRKLIALEPVPTDTSNPANQRFGPAINGKPIYPTATQSYQQRQIQADKDYQTVQDNIFKSQTTGYKLTREEAIATGEALVRLSNQQKFVATLDEIQRLGVYESLLKDWGATFDDLVPKITAAADALAALKKANLGDIVAGYQSTFSSLVSKRNDIQANLQGAALDPAGTKQEIAAKNARIKGLTEQLDQVNALIDGNTRLKNSLVNLNKIDPEGLKSFKNELAQIPGLESIVNVKTEDVGATLVAIAEQFGLSGKAARQFFADMEALAIATAALNGLKAIITIEVDRVDKYAKQGEDVYIPGQSPTPRPAATTDPTVQALIDSNNKKAENAIADAKKLLLAGSGSAFGSTKAPGSGGSAAKNTLDVSNLDIGDPIYQAQNRQAIINEAIKRAQALQHKIPGEDKEAKNDVVALLHGTEFLQNVKGVKEEYLRKAIEELTAVEKKRLEFDTKADTIRRIRIGSGDFAAIANVPFSSSTGLSVGSPTGPITVNLNIAGQVLTPAQFATLSDTIAARLKQAIINS